MKPSQMSYDGGYGSFGGGAAPAGEVKILFWNICSSFRPTTPVGLPLTAPELEVLLHQTLVDTALQQLQAEVTTQVELRAATEEDMAAAKVETHRRQLFKLSPIQRMVNSSTLPIHQITKRCLSVVSLNRQLLVSRFPCALFKFISASLRAHFEQFGAVKDVEIKVDPSTGLSRGFGFVLFELPESVNAVVAAGQQFLDGKRIDPKPAEKRNCKVFIGGINPATASETVQELMETFGEVENFERYSDFY